MSKVSVVIPVYNVEAYLPACLDSVLSQTLADIEVLCVDDASPDGCGAILDRYAARDPRVRVFHLPENRRQGYGRNLGMDHASGKYVYFLDSDDMITETALEELYAAAEADALQAVFFDAQVIYESADLERRYRGAFQCARFGTYPEGVVSGTELFDLFMRQDEWTCYVQRQLWRLSFLRENGIRFPDGVEHEDELLPFEGLLLAERVRYVRKPYFIRRWRENSVLTTPPTAKNFHGYFMNFCLMNAFVQERGIRSYAAQENIKRMAYMFERYYRELKDREDLSAWFRPDELPLFRLYEWTRAAEEPREADPGIAAAFSGKRFLYVYGAGTVGKKAIRALSETGFPIDGVVVSRMEGNPAVLMGHRVTEFRGIEERKAETLLVLAMTAGYVKEVRAGLEAEGWTCLPFLRSLR